MSVIDDAGVEHVLSKLGHNPQVAVPEAWWRPLVEERVAQAAAAAAQRAAEEAELAAGWNVEAQWVGMIQAAFANRHDPDVELQVRALLRLLRDRGVI